LPRFTDLRKTTRTTANEARAALRKAEASGVELPGSYDKALADIWKRDPKRAAALHLPRV
jgi:hypothetical protein